MYSLPCTRGTDCSNAMAAPLSAMVLGLPDFDTGTSNVRRCQSTCSHLAWVISLRRAPVSNSSLMAWAATWFSSSSIAAMSRLRLLGGQEALPMDLRGHAEASGRVGADARHVPFPSEIEDVAQQHQHAIGGPGGVAVGAHTVDQLGDAFATDLVEGEVTQGWQDADRRMISSDRQLRLVSLACGR